MVVAPAPPALAGPADAADAAIAPPPAPADPAPIPTGTILARVYGSDEIDPMVDAEVHAQVQDVQLEGEVLVVNRSTLTSMLTTAVVLSAGIYSSIRFSRTKLLFFPYCMLHTIS